MSAPAVVRDAPTLRARTTAWRRAGERIGLVPTMGNLHEGHLDLVNEAARHADRVVVSVFVNPLQFGATEDFAAYPRTLEDDLAALSSRPCDLVFAPSEAVMYPHGRDGLTRVEVPGLSDVLCGAARPGHFAGVATVVAKLFNLVSPDVAVFGEKDYQQLAVIRRMVADLDYAVDVRGMATRRAANGLALSSRNRYLDADQRRRAGALYAALVAAAAALRSGRRDFVAIQHEGMDNMRCAGFDPEYFEVRAADSLAPPAPADRRLVVLAAARLGRARLIDNVGVEFDAAAADPPA